jgi:hypothetical protein
MKNLTVLEKQVRGGIFGIKIGTKQPKDVAPLLNQIKVHDEALYDRLIVDYKKALETKK